MPTRRPPEFPVGQGNYDIPYDRSGMSEGMQIPTPGGTMKKMQFEFTDPQEAAAAQQQQAPQIPPGAGIPPSGMQGAVPPAGMQPDQQQASPLLAGVGMQGQQPDTSMIPDEVLAQMVQQGGPPGMEGGMGEFDPNAGMAEDMFNQGMQDPQIQQQLLLAARRQMMGGGF